MVILGEGPTDGLDDTAMTEEDQYSVLLIVFYNAANSFFLCQWCKSLSTESNPLCSSNISKGFTVSNMKKKKKN